MVTFGDLWTMDLTQACSEVALKQQQNYTNYISFIIYYNLCIIYYIFKGEDLKFKRLNMEYKFQCQP